MDEKLSIPLSPELARALRLVGGTPDHAALETLAVALFREGRLSYVELCKVLNLDRFQTDAVLKRHEVTNGGLTVEELESEGAALDRVLGPVK